MKVGDILRLVENPAHDWMKNFAEETFEVLAIRENTVQVMMVDSEPTWTWQILSSNFRIDYESR